MTVHVFIFKKESEDGMVANYVIVVGTYESYNSVMKTYADICVEFRKKDFKNDSEAYNWLLREIDNRIDNWLVGGDYVHICDGD